MTGGRVSLESEVDYSLPWPQASPALNDNLLRAIRGGKQLYIELDVLEELYRGDGIFDARELKLLLGSIGALPNDIWFLR